MVVHGYLCISYYMKFSDTFKKSAFSICNPENGKIEVSRKFTFYRNLEFLPCFIDYII